MMHNGARKWESPTEAGLSVSRPVSRILSWMTIPLGSYPGPRRATWSRALFALHRTGFGKPPRRRDAGGLLPHRFTLTAGVSGDPPVAVCFLFHFPSAFAAWLAPASCPAVSGLSSTARGSTTSPRCGRPICAAFSPTSRSAGRHRRARRARSPRAKAQAQDLARRNVVSP